MPIVEVKGVGQAQFPDDMSQEQIKDALQKKFAPDYNFDIPERYSFAKPSELSMQDKVKGYLFDVLTNNNIISNPYSANKIADNLSTILSFLPGTGTAFAGDEAGRALKEGDYLTTALNTVGEVPLVGEVLGAGAAGIAKLNKGLKGRNPISMEDTTRNRSLRDSKIVSLPQGSAGASEFERIKETDPNAKVLGRSEDGTISIQYLDEYEPQKVSSGNDYLFEFDPDALEVTEGSRKSIETYKGDPSKPIAVTKSSGDYFILDGHHRAKLAKQNNKNVKAVVIPFEDVEKMKSEGIHQGDMLKEWIARGDHNKSQPTAQSLPMNEVKALPVVGAKQTLKNKFPDFKIGISESADNIILDKIIVPEGARGSGQGTEFMVQLISDADKKGKSIGLTPSSDFGGNKKRLTEFYKRFGFVENKGKNKDFTISETMVRPPR